MGHLIPLLPGLAFMLASKPMFDRGTASYIDTRRRTAVFYFAFFCFFGGIGLVVAGLLLTS